MEIKEIVSKLELYSKYGDRSYSVLSEFLTKELDMEKEFSFKLKESCDKMTDTSELYYDVCNGIVVSVEADTKTDKIYNFILRAELSMVNLNIPINRGSYYEIDNHNFNMRVFLDIDGIGELANLYDKNEFWFNRNWTIGSIDFLFGKDYSAIYRYLGDAMKDVFAKSVVEIDILDIIVYRLLESKRLRETLNEWYEKYTANFMKYLLEVPDDIDDDENNNYNPRDHLDKDKKRYLNIIEGPEFGKLLLDYGIDIYAILGIDK